jgi:uncharacterized membrane protein (UPF0182 family)
MLTTIVIAIIIIALFMAFTMYMLIDIQERFSKITLAMFLLINILQGGLSVEEQAAVKQVEKEKNESR